VLAIFVLGMLLLGPKRMTAILGHLSRAKAQMEHATRNLKAQLDAEVEPTSEGGPATSNPKVVEER
jgi:Sec-independent protein translocase protein TatA